MFWAKAISILKPFILDSTMDVYGKGNIDHEADYSNPIHHGVIRYVPSDDIPPEIRNQLPSKNDRPFVYVPVGCK